MAHTTSDLLITNIGRFKYELITNDIKQHKEELATCFFREIIHLLDEDFTINDIEGILKEVSNLSPEYDKRYLIKYKNVEIFFTVKEVTYDIFHSRNVLINWKPGDCLVHLSDLMPREK